MFCLLTATLQPTAKSLAVAVLSERSFEILEPPSSSSHRKMHRRALLRPRRKPATDTPISLSRCKGRAEHSLPSTGGYLKRWLRVLPCLLLGLDSRLRFRVMITPIA